MLLKFYLNSFVKQDLITKFNYFNCLEIPYLYKIVLRFQVNQTSLRSLLPCIAGLFLISSQKPLLVSKERIGITLKVRSGIAVSCKVDLRKKGKYQFLERFLFFILPRIPDLKYTLSKASVRFMIDNIFLFKEFEKDYEYFPELPKLTVDFFFKVKTSSEIFMFLNALKFPL